MYGYYDVTKPPYNAKGDGVANDRPAFAQLFFDVENIEGAVVFIPRGIYRLEFSDENKDVLAFKGNRCTITGGGTLKAADSSLENPTEFESVLNIMGNYNVIERIRINGNGDSTHPPSAGRREGLRVQGAFNHFRDLFVENTYFNPNPPPDITTGHTYSVPGSAKHNLFERCISSKAGQAAFVDSGDFNTFRDNVSLNYRRKGFSGGGPVSNRRDIHGHFATSDSFDTNAALDYDLTPANVNSLSVSNLIGIAGEISGGSAKMGFADRLSIINCRFEKRGQSNAYALAFQAGGRVHVIDTVAVGNVRHNIAGTHISPIKFLSYRFTTIDAISIINNQPVNELACMEQVWAERFLVRDCRLLNFKREVKNEVVFKGRGIEWAVPDDKYQQILVTNCLFQSQIDDSDNTYDIMEVFEPDPPADGQLIHSSKIVWQNNVDNKQGNGTGQQLTAETAAIRGLLDMRAWKSYQATAAPTSSDVQYSVADVIWRSDPSVPGTIGWVCTSATPAPGTFKAFGNIG